MEAISVILTILSLVIGIAKLVIGSDKPAPREKEYFITANLKVPVDTIKACGIEEGEAVTLQPSGDMVTINVTATGTSWTPVQLGSVSDYELYSKVSLGRAKAKIFAINGDVVTIEFKYI
ncbi:hypothetical protein HYN59_10365 [Flavobacterium album]|uniref:Uncharacterized protein n=1 Tax=Flavobacterium album TaxID=2175091 RepID=A0A2S1QYK2_9FLAO|nr:hypothetical protein [Flavobacterium album]AWH85496.1 hypothetical protein HYN59_10365 [Flavobacterium album]